MSTSAGDAYPFNVEGLLRSRGDFKTLLDIDRLILRSDLTDEEKSELIGITIQTVLEGDTKHVSKI
ncbi:hypothetical protein ALO93_200072 [Pseudomonas amygdali pv. sesami]|jgi:hypothetical protein|nr:hypothetical protein ALO93_200072 [Pseudomonas amygdali pv. sesami]QOQ33359.1 hypothetical protein [Pseudomonas syringae pv. actinidiae]